MSDERLVGVQPIFVTALAELQCGHIDDLVLRQVRESRYLDYKSAMYPNSDEGRVRLLKHVCGFANAGGGLLIFGVAEDGEEPIRVCGVPISDTDVRNVRTLIHEGIQPTLHDVETHVLQHPQGSVLVLRVPMGFDQPHLVTYKSHHRFYIRLGSDTLPMTPHQIRRAFEQTNIEAIAAAGPRQWTAPVNQALLVGVYNAIAAGDAESAKAAILGYIRTANRELGARESTLNAISLDDGGYLSTDPEAQWYALSLAKSNTYADAITRRVDRVVNDLGLLNSFLAQTRDLVGRSQDNHWFARLVQRKHEADLEYEALVDALGRLVDALRSPPPTGKPRAHRKMKPRLRKNE